MMKTLLPITLCLFIASIQNNNAQNLVQNGSFEDYISCPDDASQVNRAEGWESFSASPDYCNVCTQDAWYSVPENIWGVQPAAEGNAYCGFYAFYYPFPPNDINVREHIGQFLSAPLVIGKKYTASIKVSLAPNLCYCASNNIGVKFTTGSYTFYAGHATSPLVDNTAQIYTDVLVTDTIGWTTISGSFIADSAYQYIVIGNFFDDEHTDTTTFNNFPICESSYYYVDDVILLEDPTTNVISPIDMDKNIIVYTGASKIFIHSNFQQKIKIEIYNTFGQCLTQSEIAGQEKTTVDLSNLPHGYYFLRATTDKVAITKTVFLSH